MVMMIWVHWMPNECIVLLEPLWRHRNIAPFKSGSFALVIRQSGFLATVIFSDAVPCLWERSWLRWLISKESKSVQKSRLWSPVLLKNVV